MNPSAEWGIFIGLVYFNVWQDGAFSCLFAGMLTCKFGKTFLLYRSIIMTYYYQCVFLLVSSVLSHDIRNPPEYLVPVIAIAHFFHGEIRHYPSKLL